MAHIDEWLEEPILNKDERLAYAKFVLCYFRYARWKQEAFKEYMDKFKLFCTHRDMRYRVTGADKSGKIKLSEDLESESGFKLWADVDQCSNWSNRPDNDFDTEIRLSLRRSED